MYLERLKTYATKLEDAGYHAKVLPADETKEISEILCLAHVDDLERDYIFQIMYINELAEAQGVERSSTDLVLLQLTMRLPFSVAEPQFSDTARILHIFNIMMPIGQLVLSEQEKTVFFRGVLTHSSDQIESSLVIEAVRMALFFIQRFSKLFEPIMKGEQTYTQVVQALTEQGKQLSAIMTPASIVL